MNKHKINRLSSLLGTILGLVFIIPIFYSRKNLLEIIGLAFSLLTSIYFGRDAVNGIYSAWIAPALGKSLDLRQVGKWALVTGATDGIGKAYSTELAKQGLNIVLVSRTESKLKQVAQELTTKYGISTEIITVDFTKGQEIYIQIQKRLKELDLEIGVLINNVGTSYPFPEYFLDLPEREKLFTDLLNCNILSVVMMTSILLPGMVERGKGVVVNVGSISSIVAVPFMTLYAATKSFMQKFTLDLSLEYEPKGVYIQYIYPSLVATNMARVRNSSWFIPSPEEFAQVAVKSIGIQDFTAVWISHRIICYFIKLGVFLRPQWANYAAYTTWKGVWLHAKRNLMRRSMKSMETEKFVNDENNNNINNKC